MRIPKNIITSNYTSGGKYMFTNQREYKGHYYELNGKTYAGKEYNPNALEIVTQTAENINPLLNNVETYAYGRLTGIKMLNNKLTSTQYSGGNFRYFVQKVNEVPYIIKEVSQETFNIFSKDPLYVVVKLSYFSKDNIGYDNIELQQAEKIIPGITLFTNGEDL